MKGRRRVIIEIEILSERKIIIQYYCLEHIAIDPACVDHYSRTVSEWSKDNTVSFDLRDMIRRFRDCLGR